MTLSPRSLLFVPADSERKISRALSSAADALILDLEDSVAEGNKAAARSLAAEVLGRPRPKPIFVRVNALSTSFAKADVDAVMPGKPDGLIQPKTRNGQDVLELAAMAGQCPIIAISTETAASLLDMASYGKASSVLLGLSWGGEDLSAELGASSNRDEKGAYTDPYRLARALCLLGARAAGIEPIDSVYTNYRDPAGLEAECREGAREGFSGKLAIHPDQIAIINACFTPSLEQRARAERVVAAFAAKPQAGVIGLDGEMLDMPHLLRAQRVLARTRKPGA